MWLYSLCNVKTLFSFNFDFIFSLFKVCFLLSYIQLYSDLSFYLFVTIRSEADYHLVAWSPLFTVSPLHLLTHQYLHLYLWLFNQSVCLGTLTGCHCFSSSIFQPDTFSNFLFGDWPEAACWPPPQPAPSQLCKFMISASSDTDLGLYCGLDLDDWTEWYWGCWTRNRTWFGF